MLQQSLGAQTGRSSGGNTYSAPNQVAAMNCHVAPFTIVNFTSDSIRIIVDNEVTAGYGVLQESEGRALCCGASVPCSVCLFVLCSNVYFLQQFCALGMTSCLGSHCLFQCPTSWHCLAWALLILCLHVKCTFSSRPPFWQCTTPAVKNIAKSTLKRSTNADTVPKYLLLWRAE